MAVIAAREKAPRHEVESILSRKKRMESCNQFWEVEVYQNSRVKRLIRTYLCHDRFCLNCKQLKRLVLRKRFMPYMELYRHSLYHVTLTVPACTGEALGDELRHMARCFKTLVNYLNGNKAIRGLDLVGYGFKGCVRSLEIAYDGDVYRPHYHVAAVFENPAVADDKHIDNQFSMSGRRLFSVFESILQRVWWMLVNRQRLCCETIFAADSAECDRYSCVVDKFQPEDYGVLFGYITKAEGYERMEYHNFKTLYYALNRVRQIQGYGVFYNVKAAEDSPKYTEQEYRDIEDYIHSGDMPVESREPLSRLANDTTFTVIRSKYTGKKS
jgi:hypothetical protein